MFAGLSGKLLICARMHLDQHLHFMHTCASQKRAAVGLHHALLLDGSGDVYISGTNSHNHLSNPLSEDRKHPTFKRVEKLSDIISVAAGDFHSLALDKDGRVYSCGKNYHGQLGLDTDENQTQFTAIPIPAKITLITAGTNNSYAVSEDGKLFACGANYFGQLGLGFKCDSDQSTFVQVPFNGKVVFAAAGDNFALVVDDAGKLYGCGTNYPGNLGLPNSWKEREFLELIPLGTKIIAAATGERHSLILDSDGKFYVAGSNGEGQLGLGRLSNRGFFTHIPSRFPITAIAAGKDHSLILDSEGNLYGSGANRHRQLGLQGVDVVRRFEQIPVELPKRSKIISIFAGSYTSMFLTSNGDVYGCGHNEDGICTIYGGKTLPDFRFLRNIQSSANISSRL